MPTLDELAKGPTSISDWFTSLSEHVAESRRVIEDLSKEDPPTEPFRSKYAGRNMLKSALERTQNFTPSTDKETSRVRLAQATVYYYLGQVSAEVEEPQEAEKYFQSSIEVLNLEPVLKYNIGLRLQAHNLLATVWSGRGNHKKAFELLEKAKELHATYVHSKQSPPHAIDEIFMDEKFTDDERTVMFEKLYTNTLFYLAQVYGALGDNKQAAAHCHITLQRQLESDDFDPLDWSLNCATLSQYYLTLGNYKSARHTLSSASSVISNVENVDEEDASGDSDKIKKTRADIERCWVKYCVNLMKESVTSLLEADVSDKVSAVTEVKNSFDKEEEKEEKLEDKKDEAEDPPKEEKGGEEKAEEQQEGEKEKKEEEEKEEDDDDDDESGENKKKKQMKTFSDLVDLEDIELLRISNIETGQYEELVPDETCSTYEEARQIFKAGTKFATNATDYYTFDEHVTDHVEIKQDISTLYKGLTHFDPDESRQCKMHKRRIDLLTDLVTPLNKQHFLQLCRQIRFELGEARNQMVSLKYSIAAELPPQKHNWKKINNLCIAAIQEFQNFIDLLNDPNGNFPEVLAEDTVKPYIVARVYIARLYGKLRAPDGHQKILHLRKALDEFERAIAYYDNHAHPDVDVTEEISVAREMITFLPIKMEKIRNTL